MLINLLIATMSDTFARVQTQAQAEYIYVKYSRMRLYVQRPAPVLDAPRCILHTLRRTVNLLSDLVSIAREGIICASLLDAVAYCRELLRSSVRLTRSSKAQRRRDDSSSIERGRPPNGPSATSSPPGSPESLRRTTSKRSAPAGGWGSELQFSFLFEEELSSKQDRRSKTEVMTEVSPSPFNRLGAQSSTGGKRMPSAKFDEALRECGATTPRRSRNISRTSSQASTEEEPALVRASKSAEGQVADVGTTSTDGQLIARRFVQAQVGRRRRRPSP